jgi:hypothetical protein
MLVAGFIRTEWHVAEHIHQEFVGHALLENSFTQKGIASQLASLAT